MPFSVPDAGVAFTQSAWGSAVQLRLVIMVTPICPSVASTVLSVV